MAQDMQVVAPDEAVGFVRVLPAEGHALRDLSGQVDARIVLLEAQASVPAFGFGVHRNVAEARRRSPEVLLLRQRFGGIGVVRDAGVGVALVWVRHGWWGRPFGGLVWWATAFILHQNVLLCMYILKVGN